MANDVNNSTTHVDRTLNTKWTTTDNNNTAEQATHSTPTSQETKEQQENERITGDIFYPFPTEHPTTNILLITISDTPAFIYKTRPKYIHNKLNSRQIHKLDDEYDSLRSHDTVSQADQKRLNEIDKITERWEQQDTHTTKRWHTQDIKPQQHPKQLHQHQHHRKILTHKQI